VTKVDLNTGVRGVELSKKEREVEKGIEAGAGTDAQGSALQTADRRDGLLCFSGAGDQVLGFFVKDASGDRQLDPAGRADKERSAKFQFERADGRRKSRLDDIHPAGGAGEMLLVSGGDEMFELSQIHGRTPGVIV
jgi:hypothetical protein